MNDEAEVLSAGSAASSPSLSASSPYSAASPSWHSNDAQVARQRSSLSPSLSSSSYTPSSGNLDEGLSDISSLDGDDFELVDAPPVAATSIIDSARWEDTLLSNPSGSDSTHTRSRSNCSASGHADHTAHLHDSWTEAEALNSSLGNAHDVHRVSSSSSQAAISVLNVVTPTAESAVSIARSTPRQSGLLPATTSSASLTAAQQAVVNTAADSVQSLFQFPDPMGDSCSASEATASVAASTTFSLLSNSANALRNPWQVPASSRGAPATPPNATVATLPSTPASPERVAVSTLAASSAVPTSLNATELMEAVGNDCKLAPTPKLPASLNVFYLGRKPAKDILWRVSLAIRTSLLASLAAQGSTTEPSFGPTKLIEAAPGVQFTWRRASVTKKACIDLREFSCTTSLGAGAAAATPWLRVQGATEVARGGALIVCFLEHGESLHSLGADLAYLLSKHQKQADTSEFKPLLLPILCPHQPENLDGSETPILNASPTPTAASSSSPSILRAVAHQMDLRNVERQWRSVLVEARFTLDLISGTTSQQLAVTLPPANRIHTVLTYQQLALGAAPSWFAGNEAWAMQAARPATKVMLGAPLLGVAPAPSWVSKTTHWLENNGAEEEIEREGQFDNSVIMVTTRSIDAIQGSHRQRTHTRSSSVVPRPSNSNAPNALRLLAGVPGIGALLVALVAVVFFMTSHSSRITLAPSPCTPAAVSTPLMHKLRASLPLMPPTHPETTVQACAPPPPQSNLSARPSRKAASTVDKAVMAAPPKELTVFAPPAQVRHPVNEASGQQVLDSAQPLLQEIYVSVAPYVKQGYAWVEPHFEWAVGQAQLLWSEVVAMLNAYYHHDILPFLKSTFNGGTKAAYQEASTHARSANGILKHASLQADFLFQHGVPLLKDRVKTGYAVARDEADAKARLANGALKQASQEAKAGVRSLTARLVELQLDAHIKERARQAVELSRGASKSLRKGVEEVKANLPRMAHEGTTAAAQIQRDARAMADETREQVTRSANALRHTARETIEEAVQGARISHDKITLVVEEVRAKTKQRHAAAAAQRQSSHKRNKAARKAKKSAHRHSQQQARKEHKSKKKATKSAKRTSRNASPAR